ncbi:3-methyl-2-oxobutanoate hydroxymethyltransferase [Sphaeroforma arctica JP610]|uniref:3-methyl-2-oxobutanoate hydroxymethyltransferase n=1 Tax=Sphaeroforma arctica JP610 TaxID=667725 RepID=A0A0L0FW97_9EUKA|nr:3-methyl-2-oxobutanoate hydroxymethyltransferase [Sphaeroforma arctica JP610]KNC81087.1 3-methyl-2-oxobutanoate hydroxymethyltransferase [Sphaeroforma arctica JP610]|eukprot:XP_014154989.1 3-methyl-2-oxobutanoate hydroxymethyltransferase [Sphaeroforma arctica JP610]
MILVGDSLAMVALGYESTTEITLEEMFHHSRAVSRGTKRSFLVGDMPFGSYQASPEDAARNAIRFIKEANVQAVKLEGGEHMGPAIEKVVGCGVPVLGHIGLTPQSVNVLGGFKVQGKTADSAQQLVKDALALQKAGCFAIVIEAVPSPIAEYITKQISIPTIGIGAGPHTSGQVLVTLDMLGVFDRFTPKFCRQYAQLASTCHNGLKKYIEDVRDQHKAQISSSQQEV